MKNVKDKMTDAILKALPQLQCKKCTYDDCKSYAIAITKNNESADKCEPGSTKTKNQLIKILKNNSTVMINEIKSYHIADIDIDECIGCTICIKVCPVDAIIGARHQQHYIVEDRCNGCELCIAQCPVDCMKMKTNAQKISWVWPSHQSEESEKNYYNKLTRITMIEKQRKLHQGELYDEREIQNYIQSAIEKESLKHKSTKKYE